MPPSLRSVTFSRSQNERRSELGFEHRAGRLRHLSTEAQRSTASAEFCYNLCDGGRGADCDCCPGEETEAWQTEIGDTSARGRVRARTKPARAASIQYICSGEQKALLGVLWPLSPLALEMQDGGGGGSDRICRWTPPSSDDEGSRHLRSPDWVQGLWLNTLYR